MFGMFFELLAKVARRQSLDQAWKDPSVWELISEIYEREAPEEPFLDFFWACRFLAAPIWRLLGALHRVPAARLYHSPSTGYAGLLASVAARSAGVPFLLSEHGIYVRERIAEIHGAGWIEERKPARPELLPHESVLRSMWIEFFSLACPAVLRIRRAHYLAVFQECSPADLPTAPRRTKSSVIPNGIDLGQFEQVGRRRREWLESSGKKPTVGFLGRVVAIKDVKTLLEAAALVRKELADAEFIIAGPTAEDPEYFSECEALCNRLGLNDCVTFPGPMERGDLLSRIDVMALTSVSEGLPFVVLEAFASGVPVASTDVGACGELIRGQLDETPALGAAGTVSPVGDVQAIAEGLLSILQDRRKAEAMGRVGRARAEASYRHDDVVQRFRESLHRGYPDNGRSE